MLAPYFKEPRSLPGTKVSPYFWSRPKVVLFLQQELYFSSDISWLPSVTKMHGALLWSLFRVMSYGADCTQTHVDEVHLLLLIQPWPPHSATKGIHWHGWITLAFWYLGSFQNVSNDIFLGCLLSILSMCAPISAPWTAGTTRIHHSISFWFLMLFSHFLCFLF